MRRVRADEFQDQASEYLEMPRSLGIEFEEERGRRGIRRNLSGLGNVAPEQEIAAHFRRSWPA